jgi:hypothetical protein
LKFPFSKVDERIDSFALRLEAWGVARTKLTYVGLLAACSYRKGISFRLSPLRHKYKNDLRLRRHTSVSIATGF